MADVGANAHVEIAVQSAVVERLVEEPGDGLGVLVIRSDPPVANQSVRRGQPLEQVDLNTLYPDQFISGVAAGRAGADNCHLQRTRLDGGMRAGMRGVVRHQRMMFEVAGIDLPEPIEFRREFIFRVDRPDRALLLASATVNADVRFDIQHLGVGERPHASDRANALDGAYRHATGILATVLRDDIRHGGPLAKSLDE